MPLRIGDTDNQMEATDRREGCFNTDKAERNIDQEEQRVPYVVPEIQLRLEAGQAWCANVCYNGKDFKVVAISPEDIKFTIYEAMETNLRTRVLHLEPGTIGFNSFTPAEYLEEMLGCMQGQGGVKQEFEHKKQAVNEEAPEYIL